MEELVMSVNMAEHTPQIQRDVDISADEMNLRHRAIATAFYACMVVVSLQVGAMILEIVWGGS